MTPPTEGGDGLRWTVLGSVAGVIAAGFLHGPMPARIFVFWLLIYPAAMACSRRHHPTEVEP